MLTTEEEALMEEQSQQMGPELAARKERVTQLHTHPDPRLEAARMRANEKDQIEQMETEEP